MRKTSFKMLSILLAVMLTVSLIPAVSAETTLAPADIKIVYSMEDCGLANGAYLLQNGAKVNDVSYATTNGFWMLGEIDFSSSTLIQRSTTCKGIVFAPAKDNWWSIKIKVPQAGLYELNLNYSTRSNGGTADIYFGGSELTTKQILSDESLNKGTVVFYDSNYPSTYNNGQTKTIANVEVPVAGEYTIVVKATYKGNNGTGGSAYRQFINSFVLQGSDTAVAGVLGSVAVGENDNKIKVGETFTPALGAVYNTDERTTIADTDGVTYSSDNPKVFDVVDGKVLAKKIGTANIIASKDGWANTILTKVEVVPTLDWSDITCVYSTEIDGVSCMDNVSYTETSGLWKFAAKHSNATLARNTNHGVQGSVAVGGWWAMEIYVPKAGAYTLKLNHSKSSDCGVTGIYFGNINTKPATLVAGDELGTVEFYHSASSKPGFESTAGVVEVPTAGTYIVAFKALAQADGSGNVSNAKARHYFKSVILDGCTVDTKTYAPIISSVTATPASIEVDGEATVMTKAALMSDAANPANATITYAVADGDEAVATVSGNTVTGLSEGTATIIATATQNGISTSKSVDITVTAPAPQDPSIEIADTEVTVGVQAETANGTVSSNLGSAINEVEMGTTVTVTAEANPGYEFAYWKNSAGTVLSENATESFVVNTNSSFTAVFDKIATEVSDEVDVYLYNANGMPFWSDTVEKGTTFATVAESAFTAKGDPTFAGYVFEHWSNTADKAEIPGETKLSALTRAVAIYSDSDVAYTVKVNGSTVASNIKYGRTATVSCHEPDFVCWKLGDKIVSYESDYTFFVWRNVDLTSITGEATDAMPVAALDKSGETYHLIYGVPAGYTRIEAGIIFGTQPDVTIDSTDGYKLSAVRGTGHFTATSDFAYARGYIIYKTPANEIRILYAD